MIYSANQPVQEISPSSRTKQQCASTIHNIYSLDITQKNYTPAVRSKLLSKLLFASFVWYSDRAYYGLCFVVKDIGRRLLELQRSHQGQQGDVSQSVRGNYKTRFWRGRHLTAAWKEMHQFIMYVYPASRITGEGRAEFLRTWGHGFEQEAAVGGHNIEYLPKKLYRYCCCRVVICSVRRTPDAQQPTHAKRLVRKRQRYRLVTHPWQISSSDVFWAVYREFYTRGYKNRKYVPNKQYPQKT